jgi:hypothetical protein
MTTTNNILADHGFEIEHTGGGCLSLVLTLPNGCAVWVTDQGGCDVPTWVNWMVGVYPADWEGDGNEALFMACSDDSLFGLADAVAAALAI